MGRSAKFTEDGILDAAASLLTGGGPSALSVAGVARRLSAPSGSLYHRFESRDHLAAALWMRTVERFDAEAVAILRDPADPVDVAVAAARGVVEWSTAHPLDASVLTMFRREDLLGPDVGADLDRRARALGRRQRAAIDHLASRLGEQRDLVAFAVAGIPLAAVRPYVGDQRTIPAWVADRVESAVRGALAVPRRRHPTTSRSNP